MLFQAVSLYRYSCAKNRSKYEARNACVVQVQMPRRLSGRPTPRRSAIERGPAIFKARKMNEG